MKIIRIVFHVSLTLFFSGEVLAQPAPQSHGSSRFVNITEIYYTSGVGTITILGFPFKNEDESFGFQTINGALINENISLGIGVGYEKYKNAELVPLFLEARGYPGKNENLKPVLGLDFGYALGTGTASGGILIHPQAGVKSFITEKIAWGFTLGLKLQQQSISTLVYDPYGTVTAVYNENVFYKFLTFKAGFYF